MSLRLVTLFSQNQETGKSQARHKFEFGIAFMSNIYRERNLALGLGYYY